MCCMPALVGQYCPKPIKHQIFIRTTSANECPNQLDRPHTLLVLKRYSINIFTVGIFYTFSQFFFPPISSLFIYLLFLPLLSQRQHITLCAEVMEASTEGFFLRILERKTKRTYYSRTPGTQCLTRLLCWLENLISRRDPGN